MVIRFARGPVYPPAGSLVELVFCPLSSVFCLLTSDNGPRASDFRHLSLDIWFFQYPVSNNYFGSIPLSLIPRTKNPGSFKKLRKMVINAIEASIINGLSWYSR